MRYLLGIDTGGTYTDAVVLDDAGSRVVASAKALTTRRDLAVGIGTAIDAALAAAAVMPQAVAMVSLSTTLATNALVEGQGGRVALVFIGFSPAELTRAGLTEAMAGDPVIELSGGHRHDGTELAPLDLVRLEAALQVLPSGIGGIAVAASFATRNPAHENAARDLIRRVTGVPVTCSHELSAALNGPKRALTAVLNARLIGMIDRLITACEAHMAQIGIVAPFMVVQGDGALVPTAQVRLRPIETILSGPAASVVGARWLTGAETALVADIGGTTTDVALLRGGLPQIDPEGARVGPYRTMVEAVAMRTTGLGGDSELHLAPAPEGGLRLGPRRLVPVALLAAQFPEMVHAALDRAFSKTLAGEYDGRFVLPQWRGAVPPPAENARDAEVLARLGNTPAPMASVVHNPHEEAALMRRVARGDLALAGVTPSDAAHVLGRLTAWDAAAADKALRLFARRRDARGSPVATSAASLAQRIIDQLTVQTVDCLLEAAFAEDGFGEAPETLARHSLTRAGLAGHKGVLQLQTRLAVPVIGLGASAASYYGAVGERLGCEVIVPEHAGVANAIGAVVGQVAMHAEGVVTAPAPGRFVAHLPEAPPQTFASAAAAMLALEVALTDAARGRAIAAGVDAPQLHCLRELREAEVEGAPMLIEARLRVTASGRPRIARG